jgi:hypothetical protein
MKRKINISMGLGILKDGEGRGGRGRGHLRDVSIGENNGVSETVLAG